MIHYGLKAVVLAERQYEDLELWYPKLRLTEAGVEVTVAGPERTTYSSKHGYEVTADAAAGDLDPDDYSCIVVPGGWAPDYLRRSADVVGLVSSLNAKGAVVAAICHAGWVLASADVVRGRALTSVPSIKDDLRNAGAEWVDEQVVVDGNLITSRRPPDLPYFMAAILDALEHKAHRERGIRADVEGSLSELTLTAASFEYMVDMLNRIPSISSYRGEDFDPDRHDPLTVLRDFAAGSDPKGKLEAEPVVVVEAERTADGYVARGNSRLADVLEYAGVPDIGS